MCYAGPMFNLEDIRDIRTNPDPVLRETATPITDFDQTKLQSLMRRMAEVMIQRKGVGIAAPQIGVSQRVIGFRHEDQIVMVCNPVIVAVSEEMQFMDEGCLSCPDETVAIRRHVGVAITGQSVDGEESLIKVTGFSARIIQHEIDHLNGKLILDHAFDFSSLTS
jgi:peptide deformylase